MMSGYCYADERERVFTEDGQKIFLKIRDNTKGLLASAGAFTVENAMKGVTGDTWQMLACIDRLAELGEIRLVSDEGWTQGHVYAGGPHRA